MRFLCDMGVAVSVARWLRSGGHDAVHLRDQGLQKLPNGEIFAKARADSRVVITFDLDFGEIAAGSGEDVPSVMVFRLRNARAKHVIERLEKVLADSSAALESGAVITVEESRHRVRHLPIAPEEGDQ
jgi:predicted nuclease of predicted toxin-antitoxin system